MKKHLIDTSKLAPLLTVQQIMVGSVILMMLLRLATLGLYPVADTTEARYAEIARKMVELNDWITPWYDYGVPFWGKPPLSFWVTAVSMKLLGANEFAARLPHFLAGLLVIALLADWLRRSSVRQALLASAMLAGSLLFFVAAGAVMTDMSMTLGIVLAMRAFWLALYGAEPERRREQWLFFGGLALGMLAKGPVALILCGLPIALWAVLTGNIRSTWRGFSWLGGALLVFVLSAPWYALAEWRTPGFLDYFLVGEHWNRFMVPGWTGDRYGNAHAVARGTVWLYAIGAWLPWTLLLPILAFLRRKTPAARATAIERSRSLYLWAWALAPCLLFTASRNIIWTYALPAMPALAMLSASWLARDPDHGRTNRVVMLGALLTVISFSARIAFLNIRDEFKSANLVVAAVETLHERVDSLVFVGRDLYSPAFYSRGHAIKVPAVLDLKIAAWPKDKDGQFVKFVALQGSQWRELAPEVQRHLYSRGRYGIYSLYAIRP